MSEARALTNFAGNSVATLLIGTWTGQVDYERVKLVLDGDRPFDEDDYLDDDEHGMSAEYDRDEHEPGERDRDAVDDRDEPAPATTRSP